MKREYFSNRKQRVYRTEPSLEFKRTAGWEESDKAGFEDYGYL